ncbi:Bug family tripartite tricarboxylate transporter substrate binding protein [Hydrogenophaga laconesensis]|uniref:Tripartite-type tricarboxylate transporter receptor subunit TctC n=1 Tax=Hydrogenophaga laconesensis TaxID=1805971 RepID=A0ABU1V7Q8_9BURK|nr:Bug family tripartite tricarboxylate transporter substrate binding protein [Hydrogenophaga laconesensis]MDR7093465.1 tripartite-type tricarboxylate transporter receptor subunit TctC [Hydrogenophaga laconesensis]
MTTRRQLLSLTAALAASSALPARAQPLEGPLRVVVPYAPGGSSDRVARLVADKLGPRLGLTVVVENRTGGGGRIAAQQLKTTPANQNMLLLANPALMLVAPLVFKDAGYDPEKDYQPVSQASSYEFAVAVGAGVPVRELNHLLAWLRANPEQANFGVPATGSLPHFFGLMVGDKAGVKAQVVGYRGSGPLLTDLMGGQIPVAFDTFDTLLPQHEAGKVRILAVSSAKRSPFAPAIPTFREAGLDLSADGWNTFFAPASMPAARVAQLGQAIREVMQAPETVRRFNDARLGPVASTPEQTSRMLAAYRAQWAPVVQKSGYQP